MASNKEYVDFILDQCSGLSARAMMGEYVLYYGGKVVGGVYDDRLLVKPTKSAMALMPGAAYQLPYEGAKEMLFVEAVDDRTFLEKLFGAMYDELPEPKKGDNEYEKGRKCIMGHRFDCRRPNLGAE